MVLTLVPDIGWRTAGIRSAAIDPRLLPLLREIRSRATLRAAIVPLGMSYRGAWDLLGAQARLLGAPLVRMQRGRGAKLSPLAERLVAADDAARRRLDSLRPHFTVKIDATDGGAAHKLKIVASHDLLLAEYGTPLVDLVFRGSLESVRAYARGEADLAGFHLFSGPEEGEVYRTLLQPRRDRLIRFAEREQGLLLAPGNPHGVRAIADVAKYGLRFINRQRGSGTRQLIDHLLEQSRVDPADVVGYADEEFTHVAVAATIAAGRADAGVGVRAAASRFNLAFVPLGREHYWLVARQRDLDQARMKKLLKALRDGALKRIARRLTGYDVQGAGEILPVSAMLGNGIPDHAARN
jgi:molybdate transport repressor ModE-like protein